MRSETELRYTNSVSDEGQPLLFRKFTDDIQIRNSTNKLPEILFITSYPPRECGIATYSQDLIKALYNKFHNSFNISICPLESENERHTYTEDIKYVLNTDHTKAFSKLATAINNNAEISMVMIQHEFGFFEKKEEDFKLFIASLTKPIITVFHTVLPNPDQLFKVKVQEISFYSESIIVMTNSSRDVLVRDYGVSPNKITVIPHGTHLVPHSDKYLLKKKHNLSGKKILSTFELLSSGKGIETTLKALPSIVKNNPDVLFLIIGKTHPSVVKNEGEKYRRMLEEKVAELHLQQHVRFINRFLPLPELLEFLQLSDIYLFTSKDPNQAVSGTFSYAISCGCPIVSTPIPHVREVLKNDAGIIIDFDNPIQLADSVITILNDEQLRNNIISNGLHRMAPTAWENAAIAHAGLFEKISNYDISLQYSIPKVNLDYIKKLTTNFGMIQFSKINQPDIDSGYTLDDNARALVAMCQHFELTHDKSDIPYIITYFNFIKYCLQSDGSFLNYVDEHTNFTEQNYSTNLSDAHGRAVWALGYLVSVSSLLPGYLSDDAEATMQQALTNVRTIHSTRAMSFVIKGLYYYRVKIKTERELDLIRELANRLVQMYRHEAQAEWQWFESYLTYANSILPEAMLCAYLVTGDEIYKEIARTTFDFLLSKIFTENHIKVVSNRNWLQRNKEVIPPVVGGEQPIDVAYTIIALRKFYTVFRDEEYLKKMETSFNWFLGKNHLNQIIYNPCTGGCYDGLEESYVNLNQGAESTVSYLMAKLTMEKTHKSQQKADNANEYYMKQGRQLNVEHI